MSKAVATYSVCEQGGSCKPNTFLQSSLGQDLVVTRALRTKGCASILLHEPHSLSESLFLQWSLESQNLSLVVWLPWQETVWLHSSVSSTSSGCMLIHFARLLVDETVDPLCMIPCWWDWRVQLHSLLVNLATTYLESQSGDCPCIVRGSPKWL